jgi:hypothetical protein
MATIRDSAEIAETGDRVALTAPDQIAITGRLGGGQVASVHIRAGMQTLFTRFEINGTAGDMLIETTTFPGLQYGSLTVTGRQGTPLRLRGSMEPGSYSGASRSPTAEAEAAATGLGWAPRTATATAPAATNGSRCSRARGTWRWSAPMPSRKG